MTGPRDVCQVRNVDAHLYPHLKNGALLEINCRTHPADPPLDESGKRWTLATTGGEIEIEPGLFLELTLTRKR